MKLYENGAYLVNGRDVVINSPEAAAAVNAKTGKTVTPEDAKKQTIAYGILKSHNTSGNMEKLQIKFDKLTSHDITSSRPPGHQVLRSSRFLMYSPTVTTVCVQSVEPSTKMTICLD